MNIFEFTDYKAAVNAWITAQPSNGHGQLRKIANSLSVNSVVMSQVFRGERDLSLEQAVVVARYLGLDGQARDYFLLLVQFARAGTTELKKIIQAQMDSHQLSARELKNRIKHEKFRQKVRATFYSHWYYSAIRLGVSIERLSNADSIADYLGLDRILVNRTLDFLKTHGLVIEHNGRLNLGPQVTHVGHDSPFVNRHHANWRLKALQKMEKVDHEELYYTGPMALSKEAQELIRKQIIELIERTTKIASKSESETLACLNIDWFSV